MAFLDVEYLASSQLVGREGYKRDIKRRETKRGQEETGFYSTGDSQHLKVQAKYFRSQYVKVGEDRITLPHATTALKNKGFY